MPDITSARENLSNSTVLKGKLEGQINVLNEQIKAAEMSDEHFRSRVAEIEADKQEKIRQKVAFEEEKGRLDQQSEEVSLRRQKAEKELRELQDHIKECNEGIENGKNELLELLNHKAPFRQEDRNSIR